MNSGEKYDVVYQTMPSNLENMKIERSVSSVIEARGVFKAKLLNF
jgi:hypothetical protein